jgi:hypothetical protein
MKHNKTLKTIEIVMLFLIVISILTLIHIWGHSQPYK